MGSEASLLLRMAAARAAGELVGEPVELQDVRRDVIDYDAFLAHRAVRRVRGVAVRAGQREPWSMIEKITEGPHTASAYLVDNGRREFAFFTSDLPLRLGSAVRAPKVLGSATAAEDGKITLYLEELEHQGVRPFDAETLLATARDLGEMAGRWVGQVPDDPWLFTEWIERHSQPHNLEAGHVVLDRAERAVIPWRRSWRQEARRLLCGQPQLRRILDTLPQTLCHHDAVGANVFRSDAVTVLIDWESVGPGPVGADLASLLFSSARRGDVSAGIVTANLDAAVDAYFEGVRTETDTVSVSHVRRAVDAAIALRWKLAVDVAAAVTNGAQVRRGSQPDESPERARDELSMMVEVLLDAARRALSM